MDYCRAFELAVMYIEQHLDDEIRVDEVTKAAGYSYYHLNRQFSAALGESVGSYIKKRRLANAARQLLYTELKIIDIAAESGFESPEAFSRAFKLLYQVSPQVYRRNRRDIFISNKERLDKRLLEHLIQNVTVHPKIVSMPEIKVAGIRGETTLRDNRLKKLWERASTVYSRIPNRIPNGRGFGICEACHENTLYTMNDDVLFSEVAGIEVSSFHGLSDQFVQKVISGGRYAVFTHRGSLVTLRQTFDYIWGTWFFNTKEVLDAREDFELYDERFLGYDHPDSEMELYIPIQ